MAANRYFHYCCRLLCLLLIGAALSGCNATKRVPEGSYLLRANKLKIKSDKGITRKGELADALGLIIVQKPNSYWSGYIPFKLYKYNSRYKKYDTMNVQDLPKSVERPVIYDSLTRYRSASNLKNYLANQGYFNAVVTDTVVFKKKKAYVTYQINTGVNYRINNVFIDADDSSIAAIVRRSVSRTFFKKETEFSKSQADEERSRIVTLMHNSGYYRFSLDNVRFEFDTLNKSQFRNVDNLIESAINLLTLQKQQKKNSMDVKIIIRENGEINSYKKYYIGKVTVFPDYIDREDRSDSSMIVKMVNQTMFRYHNYFVREQVLQKQIFINPGQLYSQSDYELSISKLNDLGIFQYVRISFPQSSDTSSRDSVLDCYVMLSPAKKMDASVTNELANSNIYVLGGTIGLSFRDKNFLKGANLFSISTTGGIELGYNEQRGQTLRDHIYLQSTNFGINTSLNFPKFLFPFRQTWFSPRNMPRTQFGIGLSVLNRIDYYKMSNVTASFAYNWRQTITKSWDVAPAFATIVLPLTTDSFQRTLDDNDFLKNTYRRAFIEGENIAFTFSDQAKKNGKNYNYLRLAVEEAGLVMSGVNTLSKALGSSTDIIYDQYTKFDLDARKYIQVRKSELAMRFLAGVGLPYGSSSTLPYIKQYFVGGPYSIRGWRPRTLGPVSISDSTNTYIDRTGDIKLEANVELRFDMIQLFSGTIKLNGAVFTDAGNTWLARKSDNYPEGEFDISRLGHDIAISSGAGLRMIIASLFTVRLDAAFPIKNPYVAEDNGWVLKKVDLGNKTWRADNIVINLAIGMPF
jgi:outer membrane protein assembly factor BamA